MKESQEGLLGGATPPQQRNLGKLLSFSILHQVLG